MVADFDNIWAIRRSAELDLVALVGFLSEGWRRVRHLCAADSGLGRRRLIFRQTGRLLRLLSASQEIILETVYAKTGCRRCRKPRAECRCWWLISGRSVKAERQDSNTPWRGRGFPRLVRPDWSRRQPAVGKGALLDLFFYLNLIKIGTYVLHTQCSRQRHHQKWLSWVQDLWREFPCSWDDAFSQKHLVYQCVIPFTRLEYIGET